MTPRDDFAESGLILVDKPTEWTSHDVVNFIRRRFAISKVGHCGTLDPIATGLLVIMLGRATKLSARLLTQDKVYSGTLCLGIETQTQDRAGEVTATAAVEGVTEADIRRVAARFTGDILQVPPMVSALKVDGKRLYKLARSGQDIEREARPIHIYQLDIDAVEIPMVRFTVRCSKGTYVRTLCADIGRDLGCGGHMYDLRRLRSGAFSIDDAVTIDTLKTWDRAAFLAHMTPLASVVVGLMKG
ncbi:MAG: tRNA pseudouridine(55) synthase TruB [Lentisphaerae bacterium]|nr:tRNA pseudouridine(55) synthase TruB [Lentisphaerota bacterium]